ncbi:serine hydrolase domain-containing protein [Roseivirga sp. BDSF3-8]|uniref:serine hydrolase domain-containing protein n=1 Tax=Roseivirga sp. BDSF3-8 TaxID=3241598 RepID=UPI0035325589
MRYTYPFLFTFLSAILLHFTCLAQDIERLDGSTISPEALTEKVKSLTEAGEVHGLALAVFNNDEAVYTKTFGYRDLAKGWPLNLNTNMYGASLSKAVFAVLVMKLVEEEVLDLDTPLQSYLPKKIYEYEPQTRWHDHYGDLKDDSLYHKITARMALAHTSGFPNWRFYEEDKKLRVKQEPGSGYLYSGEGMVYLQVVIEKMTGRGLEELAQEKVFEPLGMENSAYQWEDRWKAEFARGHNTKGEGYGKDIDNEPRAPSTLETTASDYVLLWRPSYRGS